LTREPWAGPTHASEAPIAAAALRKDRRLIFIVPLVLPRQPRNAKRFYATHTEAACPPLDGLAVA
jgi:hypothetical protein